MSPKGEPATYVNVGLAHMARVRVAQSDRCLRRCSQSDERNKRREPLLQRAFQFAMAAAVAVLAAAVHDPAGS